MNGAHPGSIAGGCGGTSPRVSTVGFVGLGNMGEPMVRRLAAAGYLVRAFDVSLQARDRLAGTTGVTLTTTVSEVADGADVVILMLPDSNAVEHVLLDDGLLGHVAPAAVVVDMSSSEPARTRTLAQQAAGSGRTLVDAPVSGGVVGAKAGSLTIMTGGSPQALATVRPVLDVLGGKVVHAGDIPGAGHAIKALNNLMSAAHLLVSSEAILAGKAFGLDPEVMLDIVNNSSGKNWSTELKWPRYILPAAYNSGFSMQFMVKDARIALGLAEAAGVPAPGSRAVVETWAVATDEMPAGADHTEIARWLAQNLER